MRGKDFPDNPALGKAWEDVLAFMGEYERPALRMELLEISPEDLLKMTATIEHAVQVTKPEARKFARALFYFSLGRAYALRRLAEVPPE